MRGAKKTITPSTQGGLDKDPPHGRFALLLRFPVYLGDMPTTFRPSLPDQSFLFPPSPQDWLPEGHLAFFIADTVAALNLQAFYAPYEGDGRRNQPFDPQMMVTVLVYAG